MRWVALSTALLTASAAAGAQPTAYWAEGEQFSSQKGSVGPDRPPFGSGSECLGSSFGSAAGHQVTYRFRLAGGLAQVVLFVRYARLADDDGEFGVQVDGRDAGTIRFPPTGGWGHRAASEWAWASVSLGALEAGRHVLTLVSHKSRNNTNLDGFILAEQGYAPPNTVESLVKLPRLDVYGSGWSMPTDPSLTVADFAPCVPDPYYPPEEAPPTPTFADVAQRSPGQTVGDWRLLAFTDHPRAGVLIARSRDCGWLTYVGESGPVLTLRLPVGRLEAAATEPLGYPPDYAEAITRSRADLLGEKVLAQGEPSFETTYGLLPELVGYVPVSSATAERKLVIDERGRIGLLTGAYGEDRVQHPLFDPAEHLDGLLPTRGKRGLLGGHLPGVHYGFWDPEAQDGWEEIVFSLPGEPEETFVALVKGDAWHCLALQPACRAIDAPSFFEALARFCGHWQRELSPAIHVDLPEPRLVDASLAALAWCMTTLVGDHTKYGLGGYARDVHDGFPPTILWTGNACLEWGLTDRARAYLSHYFARFVKDDGTFDYYGPAVSEYGQMLDLVARYVRYTEDDDWLADHQAKVDAIAAHLISLRRESLKQPAEAVTRGLLYGSPEADTHKQTEFYFSGTAWACRGLTELARLYRERGLPHAEEYQQEADGLRADLNRAARASLIPGDPPFLPPYPGLTTPFPTMGADQLAAYTNYRYWPELLSAEVLDPDLADAVFEFRRRMGGELSATTRFYAHLDDWPLAQQARALIADDRVDQFLLACYGHMALQQMPGTFCAYEQVAIRGAETRAYAADYCVPAQLTMPLLVRWMLVYEERDAETLWLCKAAPRRWFAPGQTVRVRNTPTRWGPMSYEVDSTQEGVTAHVVPPPRLRGKIMLRIRRPGGERPASVKGAEFDAANEAIVVKPARLVTVRLTYE
jgi:hypothetical protein